MTWNMKLLVAMMWFSLLASPTNDDVPWVNRSRNVEFDVPIGSYDGAEVWELLGVFLWIN